uniref:Uncharacterized protein n=1 Tax=Nelumbo nucifera TaxID=4432 RepID=A0A822ZB09_NELNU|nr:TPA_asm: hypothetical protein HUJ06_015124 [Nelumbo nucifera]
MADLRDQYGNPVHQSGTGGAHHDTGSGMGTGGAYGTGHGMGTGGAHHDTGSGMGTGGAYGTGHGMGAQAGIGGGQKQLHRSGSSSSSSSEDDGQGEVAGRAQGRAAARRRDGAADPGEEGNDGQDQGEATRRQPLDGDRDYGMGRCGLRLPFPTFYFVVSSGRLVAEARRLLFSLIITKRLLKPILHMMSTCVCDCICK